MTELAAQTAKTTADQAAATEAISMLIKRLEQVPPPSALCAEHTASNRLLLAQAMPPPEHTEAATTAAEKNQLARFLHMCSFPAVLQSYKEAAMKQFVGQLEQSLPLVTPPTPATGAVLPARELMKDK